MQNDNQANESEPLPEGTLLDVADMSGYDKSLKTARNWLYVLAALQLAMGIYEYFQYQNAGQNIGWMALGIDVGIGLIFLGCAIWSIKKPVPAFLVALIAYILVQLIGMAIEPTNIFKGILIKVLVIIALVKAYKDARENDQLKKILSGE